MATNIISTGLDTTSTIYNSNGGTLISGDAVKGGYFVTDTIANIPTWSKVTGTLCFCTGTAGSPVNKFYQYNGSTWVEAKMGGDFETATTADIKSLFRGGSIVASNEDIQSLFR